MISSYIIDRSKQTYPFGQMHRSCYRVSKMDLMFKKFSPLGILTMALVSQEDVKNKKLAFTEGCKGCSKRLV